MSATVPPEQLRKEFYDALITNAERLVDRSELSRGELALAVTHGVLDIMDGAYGNGPDGKGLPLLQLMVCPNPEHSEARLAAGLPIYDNALPFDSGLPCTQYGTGIAEDFARQYEVDYAEEIKARHMRAAKELFHP